MKSLLTLLPLLALPALPHSMTQVDGETTIEDPTFSYGVEGEIGGDAVFTIHLPMPRDFATPMEILVPNRAKYEDFRPAYAVIGEGLPTPTEEEIAALPFEIPEGKGAFVDLNQDPERFVMFESFGRNVYISSGTVALPLRQGDVEVRIWSPDGAEGPFTFAFGLEENFGGDE